MNGTQETAWRIHRLDGLARLHCGKGAGVSYDPASGRFTVRAEGRTVAQGTFEEAVAAVTGPEEAR